MRAVELGPDHDLIGPDTHRATDGRRALGEQRRDAAVQDAEGLVHLRPDLDAHDDLFGRDRNQFDAELIVDVRPCAKGSLMLSLSCRSWGQFTK